jgi:hypothetical protein
VKPEAAKNKQHMLDELLLLLLCLLVAAGADSHHMLCWAVQAVPFAF